MRIKLLSLFAALLMLFCSCGKGGEQTDATPDFPCAPDKMIVGVKGEEKELLPEGEAYEKIMSAICAQVEKSGTLGTFKLSAHDPETGEHMSVGLRGSETFVEFIYNEPRNQTFRMSKAGGGYELKEMAVQRVFFALSGKYHDCIFVGMDAEYDSATTLGSLPADTSLTAYVRDLLADTAE